jgi:hypothetical protein
MKREQQSSKTTLYMDQLLTMLFEANRTRFPLEQYWAKIKMEGTSSTP